MDIFGMSRSFFDWSFENPEKIQPGHISIYFFAIEHCNRLGWKEKFGFPSQMVMEAVGIKNWRTYTKYLDELVEWGFLEMIEKSKNQYSSNIIKIAYVKNTKATTKSLDKALQKHHTKHSQSTVSIDIQETKIQETNIVSKETKELALNNKNLEIDNLIQELKQQADILGIAYNKKDERRFAKHILTAKEFGNFCEKIGQERIEFAKNIMIASEKIKFWKGTCSGPMLIYQNYAEVYNLTKTKSESSKIVKIETLDW